MSSYDKFLVNLVNMSLACEDSNSKLLDVSVADVDAEEQLVEILKLNFGQAFKAKVSSRL